MDYYIYSAKMNKLIKACDKALEKAIEAQTEGNIKKAKKMLDILDLMNVKKDELKQKFDIEFAKAK